MDRWNGRVALVTGASAGIGEAICKTLVESGMIVVGAARRLEKMQSITDSIKNAKGSFLPIKCDLTKDEDIYNLFDEIKGRYGGIDICVNNAGLSYPKSLLDGSPEEWRHVMDVNVIALCLCTKLAIASMRERRVDDGHIINLSSIAGHYVVNIPALHFYVATKHAVNALSEGLRQEMRELKSHIRISSISPGFVKTEFGSVMYGDEKLSKEMLGWISPIYLSSEDIAATLLHIISAPPHVEINDVIIRPVEELI